MIGAPGGTLTVTVTDNMGVASPFSYTLGNGSNFLTITTMAGERIASVSLQYSTPGGITDLRQIAVSGAAPVSTPEPATLKLFSTVAALFIGCQWIRSRRQRRRSRTLDARFI